MQKNANLVLDEIESIEHIGKKQTYDFVIPQTHNFIANGVLVHNSGSLEEDCDAALLLYREEYYDDDTPEKGILEIKMAKNRQLGSAPAIKLIWRKNHYENLAGVQ